MGVVFGSKGIFNSVMTRGLVFESKTYIHDICDLPFGGYWIWAFLAKDRKCRTPTGLDWRKETTKGRFFFFFNLSFG